MGWVVDGAVIVGAVCHDRGVVAVQPALLERGKSLSFGKASKVASELESANAPGAPANTSMSSLFGDDMRNVIGPPPAPRASWLSTTVVPSSFARSRTNASAPSSPASSASVSKIITVFRGARRTERPRGLEQDAYADPVVAGARCPGDRVVVGSQQDGPGRSGARFRRDHVADRGNRLGAVDTIVEHSDRFLDFGTPSERLELVDQVGLGLAVLRRSHRPRIVRNGRDVSHRTGGAEGFSRRARAGRCGRRHAKY